MEGADLEFKTRTMDLMEPFLDFVSESYVDISLFFDIMICMELIEVFKALSNESRLQILQWLKEPDRHFTPHEGIDMNTTGVCVSQITDKLKMTQSTASQYLSILQRAGLITAERIGKYTYYKRDEEAIKKIATLFEKNI
ncbi:transcriptional regulator, ArsR family [Heyndrickxia coagulans 36D1]|uniref:Transcriptional regulator, ArsR family n=2 Tax=Heyndrickxia TaxID=2837504 RepID=G2TL59_HEYCO|nr:transcriptional regulator, ArsR family [Heyndrickxia coagulans 36D1]